MPYERLLGILVKPRRSGITTLICTQDSSTVLCFGAVLWTWNVVLLLRRRVSDESSRFMQRSILFRDRNILTSLCADILQYTTFVRGNYNNCFMKLEMVHEHNTRGIAQNYLLAPKTKENTKT